MLITFAHMQKIWYCFCNYDRAWPDDVHCFEIVRWISNSHTRTRLNNILYRFDRNNSHYNLFETCLRLFVKINSFPVETSLVRLYCMSWFLNTTKLSPHFTRKLSTSSDLIHTYAFSIVLSKKAKLGKHEFIQGGQSITCEQRNNKKTWLSQMYK